MTEYEIADLAVSQAANRLALVSLMQAQFGTVIEGLQQFMTILFSYIAAAYLAGGRMGIFQVWMLSILYAFWQVWMIASIALRGAVLYQLTEKFIEEGGGTSIVLDAPTFLRPVSLALLVTALTASLYFMWSVRQVRTE